MTGRVPCPPAPGPLEGCAARFDDLFRSLAQWRGFREYLTGLLLPRDRNKTLTVPAGAESVTGAQHPGVQRLQFFLSEPTWEYEQGDTRRLELLAADPAHWPPAKPLTPTDGFNKPPVVGGGGGGGGGGAGGGAAGERGGFRGVGGQVPAEFAATQSAREVTGRWRPAASTGPVLRRPSSGGLRGDGGQGAVGAEVVGVGLPALGVPGRGTEVPGLREGRTLRAPPTPVNAASSPATICSPSRTC
ncbi:hypothetical protein GCM10010299_46770 [Streptomyces tanashiensis]|nr:hypothetical protein GCM10010299_46770 [Streptomyces tanashiensis]